MVRKLCVLIAFLSLRVGTASAPGAPPPAALNPGTLTLYQNIKRLKLDVAQHVPIHGRPGTNDEFVKIVGKTN